MKPSFKETQQVRDLLKLVNQFELSAQENGVKDLTLANDKFQILLNAMRNPYPEYKNGFQYGKLFVKPKGRIK